MHFKLQAMSPEQRSGSTFKVVASWLFACILLLLGVLQTNLKFLELFC